MGSAGTSGGMQEIRYSGLFDMDGLYAAVVDWAKNYGYMWHEKTYKHKVPSPRGAEQEFEWNLTKDVTHYYRYSIKFKIHAYEMKEILVDVRGKKKALTNGRIYLKISGKLDWDWQKTYTGSPFRRKLGGWLSAALDKDISSIHWDTLTYRILNLHSVVKTYLDMQTKNYEYKTYLNEN
jgi:hypothetical protein